MIKMILEQLMEKKDLKIYIDFRIKELQEICKKTMDNSESKQKEMINKKFSGRILELRLLKNLINMNLIKIRSKYLWKKYEYKTIETKNIMKLECNECERHCKYKFKYGDSEGIMVVLQNIGCIKGVTKQFPKWEVVHYE